MSLQSTAVLSLATAFAQPSQAAIRRSAHEGDGRLVATMLVRTMPIAAVVAVVLVLAACDGAPQTPTPIPVSTQVPTSAPTPTPAPTPTSVPMLTPTPTPTPSPYTGYLPEEIPPCTPVSGSFVDPCEPAPPIEPVFGAAGSGNPAYYTEAPLTIRWFLDGSALTYVPHIVVRGIYLPDTVRCTSGDPYRIPPYAERGYTQHSILMNCYADMQVNDYILGKGPSRLTVLVDYHHYWHGYYAHDAAQVNMTEAELVERLRIYFTFVLEKGREGNSEGIYGREVILFAGPGHSHAHEVWEVFTTWDVQRKFDGVIAVHPHRDDWRASRSEKYREHQSRLEMNLPDFEKEVLRAHEARVAEYSGRVASVDTQGIAQGAALPLLISDIHDLDGFMANTGAYDHPDGPPSQPPLVPGVDDAMPTAPPMPPGG